MRSCKTFLQLVLVGLLFVCERVDVCGGSQDGRGFLEFLFGSCKCKCGLPNREARLVGGEYLRGHEFPWLALINNINTHHTVPGTLINNRYVVTAASQVIGLTPYDVKITLGQFDRCFPDISSLNISIQSIILHQHFSPGNRAHDIALLKLTSPVTFEKRISPICLAAPGVSFVGQVATVVGWSIGGDKNSSSCRPRKLGLPVLEREECLATAFDPESVSVDKKCAGVVGAKSVVCKGDAGGPVMYRSYGGVYELIGVLTDRNDCIEKPSTALYVTISDHLQWITRNTQDACYCLKT